MELTQEQMEQALTLAYSMQIPLPKRPSIQIPNNLTHLQTEDWMAIVEILEQLMYQRQRSNLH